MLGLRTRPLVTILRYVRKGGFRQGLTHGIRFLFKSGKMQAFFAVGAI